MKKLLALCLLLSLALSLCGCGGGEPTDGELTDAAAALIEKSRVVNRLFFEEGIPVDEIAAPENNYRPADKAALRELGFDSVSDILGYMGSVWSASYMTRFRKSAVLAPVVGDNAIETYAYCFDKTNKDGSFDCVMVYAGGPNLKTDHAEYLTDTLTVTEKTKDRARLTLQVNVTKEDLPPKQTALSVTLVREQDGVWRLDSNTAVAYPTR